jgi:hypothetical protein
VPRLGVGQQLDRGQGPGQRGQPHQQRRRDPQLVEAPTGRLLRRHGPVAGGPRAPGPWAPATRRRFATGAYGFWRVHVRALLAEGGRGLDLSGDPRQALRALIESSWRLIADAVLQAAQSALPPGRIRELQLAAYEPEPAHLRA